MQLAHLPSVGATQRPAAQRHIVWTPARQIAVRAAGNQEPDRKEPPRPLGSTFFLPFKGLLPDGEVIHAKDAACDPTQHNCKFAAYVYEAKCTSCYGTGQARSWGGRGRRGRGARATLHTCMVCMGMGHVRHSTARIPPEILDNVQQVTLARQQKLPGEPEQQLPAPVPAERPGRLQKAKELFEKLTGKAAPSTATQAQPSASTPATTTNGKAVQPAPQNNIVTSGGRFSGVKVQEGQASKPQATAR